MNNTRSNLFRALPISAAIIVSVVSGTLVSANLETQTKPSIASATSEHSAGVLENAKAKSEPITEKAISAAIEQYVRAIYSADLETVRSRTHPDIARRTLADTYWGQPSDDWVRPLTLESYNFLDTSANRMRRQDPENGRCDIEIFDIEEYTAAASVVTDGSVEYLHMIHFDGRWIIADSSIVSMRTVGAKPPATTDRHTETITKILTDYCVGFYEIDGDKVQDTCHPILSKRVVETAEEGGFNFLRSITFEEINILGETFNKSMGFDPETARCDVEVYEVRKDMAIAKMTGAIWFDYFQLMRVENEWKIVNIMFEGLSRDRWEEA
jgi:Putative lumazine-binding